MAKSRQALCATRRWVVKIGSSLITNDGNGLRTDLIDDWVAQAAALCERGYQLVIVSSGAVAEGIARLGWRQRPHVLHELQSAAAVGQMGLIHAYQTAFHQYGLHTAQVLLTHEDVVDRQRYLNARSVLGTLLNLGVIPVVNENDTVANEELHFGDNDRLAGLVANLIEAELLVVLTDQGGLYTADPRDDASAKLIPAGTVGDPQLQQVAGGSGAWGRGGMRTKLEAASLAARSGTATLIAAGRTPDILTQIAAGAGVGTLLTPAQEALAARKQWLASTLLVKGELTLDSGAVRVLQRQGRSLLAVGVTSVSGDFLRGELVVCVDTEGREIARGLANYSAEEAEKIKGLASDQIEASLGYANEPELIHRDNLVVF